MTPLEALVAIITIIAVFGVSGFIVVKFIQLIRDWIIARRTPADNSELKRRIDQFEMRQEQMARQIQNLETILSGSGENSRPVSESPINHPKPEMEGELPDRPLKNKLRS